MKDDKGNGLANRLNVIFVDLLTIKKLVGTPVEKLTPLQKWGLYLSYVDDESKVEYVDKIADSDGGIMEAKTIIKRMSEEESNWFREFFRDKAMRDYNSGMEAAWEKGIAKGAQQKAVEDALVAVKEFNVSPEVAAEKMGAPLDKVLEALKELAAAHTN